MMTDKEIHIVPELHEERRLLELSWADYKWPLLFLLSMSMMGLMFPLGYILVPFILINRFRTNRYDFVIMLTLFFGGYGLIGEDTLPVKPWDIALIVSVIGAIVYRKDKVVRRTLMLIVAYAAALFFIATFSDERMSVQIRIIREYLFMIYFIVPLMVFSSHKFEMSEFFRHLMPYVFILCVFYIFDGYIICGHILLPCTHIWGSIRSTFFDPVYYGLGDFVRIYPPGLFLGVLAVYPICHVYRLTRWQWFVAAVGLSATRTFTVITGFIATYIISFPNRRRAVRYGIVAVGLLAVVYFVDSFMPFKSENNESTLRVYSSIHQILDFGNAQDEEDMAQLGSGRIGQALPKFELVEEYNKQLTGLGFLHPELTTDTRYIIDNPFYIDQEESEEVATGIEIEPLQVYLSSGYIGLAVHIIFVVFLWLIVRRMRYSRYFLTVIFALFWFGLGGFAQLNNHDGLLLAALAYSVVVLDERSKNMTVKSQK